MKGYTGTQKGRGGREKKQDSIQQPKKTRKEGRKRDLTKRGTERR